MDVLVPVLVSFAFGVYVGKLFGAPKTSGMIKKFVPDRTEAKIVAVDKRKDGRPGISYHY